MLFLAETASVASTVLVMFILVHLVAHIKEVLIRMAMSMPLDYCLKAQLLDESIQMDGCLKVHSEVTILAESTHPGMFMTIADFSGGQLLEGLNIRNDWKVVQPICCY